MRNISFCDGAQTSLHLHLDHLQFLDWDVLHRAAMLAPRAAMTFFMVMNRMRARQIPTEAPLTVRMGDWPAGTPVLRIMMRVWMRTDKEFEYFRDTLWPYVIALPSLVVRRRRNGVRVACAAAAAAMTSAEAAAAAVEAMKLAVDEAQRAVDEATRAIACAKAASEALIEAVTSRVLSRPEIIVTITGAAAAKLGGLAGQYTRTAIELTDRAARRSKSAAKSRCVRRRGGPKRGGVAKKRTVVAWRQVDGAAFVWQGETFDDVHIAREDDCVIVGSLRKWKHDGKVEWGWIRCDVSPAEAFFALDSGDEARCWLYRAGADWIGGDEISIAAPHSTPAAERRVQDAEQAMQSTKPSFGFSAFGGASPPPSLFGARPQPPASLAPLQPFVFGGSSLFAAPVSTPAFAFGGAASPFCGGGSDAASGAAAPMLSASSATTPAFSFGTPAPGFEAAASGSSDAGAPATPPAPAFVFGGAAAPLASGTAPPFGASPTPFTFTAREE